MPTVILAVGLLVFVAHLFIVVFERTQIPDVLLLILLGALAGPVFGLVQPEDFGKVGSVLSTIALVVLLFESGTTLDLATLARSLGGTLRLALATFAGTVALVTAAGVGLMQLELLPAVMLGVILGGTSSAVVIPLVQGLRLGDKARTVLILESALTDVLCIVGVFALLQAAAQGGNADAGRVVGSVLAALLFAGLIGLLGGIAWLTVLHAVRRLPNTIFTTVAFVFVLYGVTELLGFSGAIAALSSGIALTNGERLRLNRLRWFHGRELPTLTETDLRFYREAVFLLKTFFFVYLGISLRFSDPWLIGGGVAVVAAVYALRLGLTATLLDGDVPRRDAAVTSVMVPKGLAAAVLAGLPVAAGIAGGERIREVVYVVVLLSIVATAVVVPLQRLPRVAGLYGRALKRFAPATAPALPADAVAAEEAA